MLFDTANNRRPTGNWESSLNASSMTFGDWSSRLGYSSDWDEK